MVDPLSIAAGVVGLLTAATQASIALYKVVHAYQDAPPSAEAILVDVNGTKAALLRLRDYFCDEKPVDSRRAALIQIDEVNILLSTCIKTFSELHELLDPFGKCDNWTFRLRWIKLEPKILDISQKLAQHKASLVLILAVLNIEKTSNVDASVRDLHKKLDTVVYRLMKDRVRRRQVVSSLYTYSSDQASTIKGIRTNVTPDESHESDSSQSSAQKLDWRVSIVSGFQAELQRSRVYQKIDFNDPNSAMSISRLGSTKFSISSGISLSEVSNISIIGLVIDRSEIVNKTHYPTSTTSTPVHISDTVHSRPKPHQKFLVPRKPYPVKLKLSDTSKITAQMTEYDRFLEMSFSHMGPAGIYTKYAHYYHNFYQLSSQRSNQLADNLSLYVTSDDTDLITTWNEVVSEERLFCELLKTLSGIKNSLYKGNHDSPEQIKANEMMIRRYTGPVLYKCLRIYTFESCESFIRISKLRENLLHCDNQIRGARAKGESDKHYVELNKECEKYIFRLKFELKYVKQMNQAWRKLPLHSFDFNISEIRKGYYFLDQSLEEPDSHNTDHLFDITSASRSAEDLGKMSYNLLSSLLPVRQTSDDYVQLSLHTPKRYRTSGEFEHICLHASNTPKDRTVFKLFIIQVNFQKCIYLFNGTLDYDHLITINENIDVSTNIWPRFINPSQTIREQFSFLEKASFDSPLEFPDFVTKNLPGISFKSLQEQNSVPLFWLPCQGSKMIGEYKSLTWFLWNSSLSQRERLYVSMVIVSSILQLGSAPWFHGIWTSDNILMRQKDSPWLQTSSYEPQDLEISFKKDFQHTNFITASRPWCIRLGVVLIELALNEASEKLGLEMNTSMPDPEISVPLLAKLTDKVDDAVGANFGDAVRMCIIPNSDIHGVSFWDAAFRKVFSEKIEAPMRKAYENYILALNGVDTTYNSDDTVSLIE